MRNNVRFWAAALAASVMAVGSIAAAGSPIAQAAELCNGKPVTQTIENPEPSSEHQGTQGDDVVLVTGSSEIVLFARAGDDTICLNSGGGFVYGEGGDDWISGEKSLWPFSVDGGPGDDTLIGSDNTDEYGPEAFYGGPGSDTIEGRGGSDEIDPDQYDANDDPFEDDADTVDAGAGDDVVSVTTLAQDKMKGADEIIGGSGEDEYLIEGRRTDVDIAAQQVQAGDGGAVDQVAGFEKFTAETSADVTGSDGPDKIAVAGTSSTVTAKGGADVIEVTGTNTEVSAGTGDDKVSYRGKGETNAIKLGAGDDSITLYGGEGVEVTGGSGDDSFHLRGRAEQDDDDPAVLPIEADLRGGSDGDTLTWDCKSTVDVADHELSCNVADVRFSGMQVYLASRTEAWKDEFRGGPDRDVFYGGGKDDVIYGNGGNDLLFGEDGEDSADGGPGIDSCRAEKMVSC